MSNICSSFQVRKWLDFFSYVIFKYVVQRISHSFSKCAVKKKVYAILEICYMISYINDDVKNKKKSLALLLNMASVSGYIACKTFAIICGIWRQTKAAETTNNEPMDATKTTPLTISEQYVK